MSPGLDTAHTFKWYIQERIAKPGNYVGSKRKENYAKDFEEFAKRAIECRFNKFGESRTSELTLAKIIDTHSSETN